MRMNFRLSWIWVVMLVVGCAGASQKVYDSQPKFRTASNEAFEARIMPLKLENPFYVAFQLDIRNKTSKPLVIDWNKTRYLNDKKNLGRFAFKGIDPETVKTGIPDEVIAGGQTLSKRISPLKTLSFMRRRDLPKEGQSNFTPGILPNGQNSVSLYIRQADRKWRETMTVRLSSKTVQ